jgi:hypothetical protein
VLPCCAADKGRRISQAVQAEEDLETGLLGSGGRAGPAVAKGGQQQQQQRQQGPPQEEGEQQQQHEEEEEEEEEEEKDGLPVLEPFFSPGQRSVASELDESKAQLLATLDDLIAVEREKAELAQTLVRGLLVAVRRVWSCIAYACFYCAAGGEQDSGGARAAVRQGQRADRGPLLPLVGHLMHADGRADCPQELMKELKESKDAVQEKDRMVRQQAKSGGDSSATSLLTRLLTRRTRR